MSVARWLLAALRRARTALRSSRWRPGRPRDADVVVCHWSLKDGVLPARVAADGTAERIDAGAGDRRSRRVPVVALLPKSQYLVRTVETPAAAVDDVPAMLRLQAEADLPAEFGPTEISYVPLAPEPGKEGRLRFEVYVARAEALQRLTQALDDAGFALGKILPSAVAWRGALASRPQTQMLVVELPGGEVETALAQGAGGCRVRTIEREGDPGRAQLPQGVVEGIRSLLADPDTDGAPRVLWCGPSRPSQDVGPVQFEDVLAGERAASDGVGMLVLAWEGIGGVTDKDLATAQLRPRGQEERRHRRETMRRLGCVVAALLLGLLLAQASLWILGVRCHGAAVDLENRIAGIRREGERTERRVEQLRAVAATRRRRDCFQRLLTALYEHTPAGISYSEVAMDKDNRVRLRGQAGSMGQPFQLPSSLEGKGPLRHVVVRGATSSKKRGDAITEFQAELTLEREERQ